MTRPNKKVKSKKKENLSDAKMPGDLYSQLETHSRIALQASHVIHNKLDDLEGRLAEYRTTLGIIGVPEIVETNGDDVTKSPTSLLEHACFNINQLELIFKDIESRVDVLTERLTEANKFLGDTPTSRAVD